MTNALVPINRRKPDLPALIKEPPVIVTAVGNAGRTAWRDFFSGKLANEHTRLAYNRAVCQFLDWCEDRRLELAKITAGDVGDYFRHKLKTNGETASLRSKKQHLSAIRRFFNILVERHLVLINPAAVAELERLPYSEGVTPEITVKQITKLFGHIDIGHLVGLRDQAIIGILVYTGARAGAIAKLRIKDLHHDGQQWWLRFDEKGRKERDIPVRHDLEKFIFDYFEAAKLFNEPKTSPLFRTAVRREKRLNKIGISGKDICYLFKRRLHDAGLPPGLSPHSARVFVATDLRAQDVPLEDVQYLLGHVDPRTTQLYDRGKKKVTRNIVERISTATSANDVVAQEVKDVGGIS